MLTASCMTVCASTPSCCDRNASTCAWSLLSEVFPSCSYRNATTCLAIHDSLSLEVPQPSSCVHNPKVLHATMGGICLS